MMQRHVSAVLAAAATLALLPDAASANLAKRNNPNANISALSQQLLQQPASAAGRYRNVWDCDPPEPAFSGTHYFLYNLNSQGVPLGNGNESLTVKAIAPGPGYQIDQAQVLVQQPGSPNGPVFVDVPKVTSYDAPSQLPVDFSTLFEVGVMRISFSLVDPVSSDATGYINGSTDGPEIAYAGQLDLETGERGVEHARIFTETRLGHDNDALHTLMTAVVPNNYPGLTFNDGSLTFSGNFVSTGANVEPAALNFVQAPEPTALAVLGTGATALLRRRRAGRPAVA